MRLVQAHVPDFVIVGVEERDLVRLLQHLHADVEENERHAAGPALIARRRVVDAGSRDLAVLFYDVRGMRLQDRARVIADQLEDIGNAVAAGSVGNRSRAASAAARSPARSCAPIFRRNPGSPALTSCARAAAVTSTASKIDSTGKLIVASTRSMTGCSPSPGAPSGSNKSDAATRFIGCFRRSIAFDGVIATRDRCPCPALREWPIGTRT